MFKKRILSLSLLSLVLVGPACAGTVVAQENTDANSLLRDLGLPEVAITVTSDAITAPAEIPAGRVLVTVTNETDGSLGLYIVQPPSEVTQDQLLADLQNVDGFPTWAPDATWAGGVNIQGAGSEAVIVDLSAGNWFVGADRNPATEDGAEPADAVAALSVTGEAPPATEIEGSVPVVAYSHGFEFPENMSAGPQILAFRNGGSQPHFASLVKVPDGTTADQVMELVMFDPSAGAPSPDMLSFEDIQFVKDIQVVSPEVTSFSAVDLEPGTYVALCFIPDPVTGMPHAMMGMVKIFTVQ